MSYHESLQHQLLKLYHILCDIHAGRGGSQVRVQVLSDTFPRRFISIRVEPLWNRRADVTEMLTRFADFPET